MRESFSNPEEGLSLSDFNKALDISSRVGDIVGEGVINSSSNITLPDFESSRILARITAIDLSSSPMKYSWEEVFPQNKEEYVGTGRLKGDSNTLPAYYYNENVTFARLEVGQIVECLYFSTLDFVIVLYALQGSVTYNTLSVVTNVCPVLTTRTFITINPSTSAEQEEVLTMVTGLEIERTSGAVIQYEHLEVSCEEDPNECCPEIEPPTENIPALECCAGDTGFYSNTLALEFSEGTGCLSILNGKIAYLFNSGTSNFGGCNNTIFGNPWMWTTCYQMLGEPCCKDENDYPCYETGICTGVNFCIEFDLSCFDHPSFPVWNWRLRIRNINTNNVTEFGTFSSTDHYCADYTFPDPLFFTDVRAPGNLTFSGCGSPPSSLCGAAGTGETVRVTIYEV